MYVKLINEITPYEMKNFFKILLERYSNSSSPISSDLYEALRKKQAAR
jgi:hypothetical protein